MEWQVGKFRIQIATQDWFALDGGIMWSGIPRELWLAWCKPPFTLDKKNRAQMPVNCFLVTTPQGHRVLVDTSIGSVTRWKESTAKQFQMRNGFNGFVASRSTLRQSRRCEGDQLPQPNFVVPTHLHFDHAGGCVQMKDNALVPAFPKATYILHKDEVDHANEAHPKTRSSYVRETLQGIKVLFDQNKVLQIIGEEFILEEGLTLIRTRGHTPGHLSVKIESEGQTALIPGALFPTRYHAIIACGVGNDTHGLEAANHKIRFLERAEKGNWIVLLEHDPQIAFRVENNPEKETYQLVPM